MRTGSALGSDWLVPEWSASGVGAVMTTRRGGHSATPFDSFNLRFGLGDDPAAVGRNWRAFGSAIGAVPVHLNQVHGKSVARLTAVDLDEGAPIHTADASVTTLPGIACAIQVADCLPVLFAAPAGRAVGAAHAGWRGLAAGVLEATVDAVCAAASCDPNDLAVWLGACIGPQRFEVGADVLDAFGALPIRSAPRSPTRSPTRSPEDPSAARFVPGRENKWWGDLAGLARDRLAAAGVRSVTGGTWCTVSDASRFFSYRRDGVTGRMVAAVWIDRGARG